MATARATDPDPFRDAVRAQVGVNDLASLHRLIDDEGVLVSQPDRSLLLLAHVLEDYGNEKEGGSPQGIFSEKCTSSSSCAWRLSPGDFWICSVLGKQYGDESVRYSTAAVVLRPKSAGAHHNLATSLLPDYSVPWTTLPMPQDAKKNTPQLAPGIIDESIAEHRQSVRLKPHEPEFHFALAVALLCKHGKSDEAVAEINETQLLIGRGACDSVAVRLSFVLFNLGKHDAAIARCARASPIPEWI